MKFSAKHIHLVSFDVPWPADYGGVIDVFGKIKGLHSLGVNVHLHCFQYGRDKTEILRKYCFSVNYYPRNQARTLVFNRLPYIVVSRVVEELLANLSADHHPILFEGLHTCYFLSDPSIANKKRIVRAHNIEHDYYKGLARVERNYARKYFYSNESSKLQKYEKVLAGATSIAAISETEFEYFNNKYGHTFLLPAFHLNEEVKSKPGRGTFALFHGNLAVNDNVEAVEFLMDEVFNDLNIPLVVTGQNPTENMISMFDKPSIHKLVINPSFEEMEKLMADAHFHVLPVFSVSGIRLKLLDSLYNGRFCLVNSMMTKNTGLESLCLHADSAPEFKRQLTEIFKTELQETEIDKRKQLLTELYSNSVNAKILVKQFFEDEI